MPQKSEKSHVNATGTNVKTLTKRKEFLTRLKTGEYTEIQAVIETMHFEKIQNSAPSVPHLVMESLLQAIENGRIKVNEDLPPERELAESLGVGRGSLRESMAVLNFMGIIETRGNRKVVVKDADYFRKALSFINMSDRADSFADFMEFRRSNELAIARLASERATKEDLEKIESMVVRLENDPADYQADVEFHIHLANASHNMIFATILDYVNYMILDLRMRFFTCTDYHGKTAAAHRRIFEAVKAGDAESAAAEMDRHLHIIEAYAEESPSAE